MHFANVKLRVWRVGIGRTFLCKRNAGSAMRLWWQSGQISPASCRTWRGGFFSIAHVIHHGGMGIMTSKTLKCAAAVAAVLLGAAVPHACAATKSRALRAVSADTLRTEVLASAGAAMVGEAAPWIAGWTLEGEVWNIRQALADTSSDRIAMVFFATWCAPCRHGIGLLRQRASELIARRVQVVLVNFAEEESQVKRFLGEANPFPVLMDRYGICKSTYLRVAEDSVIFPQTVVIDGDGRVQLIIGREGADYVDRILAGR